METTTTSHETPRLSRPERFAAFQVRGNSSPWWVLIPVAYAVAILVTALAQRWAIPWMDIVLAVFIAALWWERAGFARLLARRDTEIERLRRCGGSD